MLFYNTVLYLSIRLLLVASV